MTWDLVFLKYYLVLIGQIICLPFKLAFHMTDLEKVKIYPQ